jgi:hypothetical protein
MYEMEGALPGLTGPAGRPPVPSTRGRYRFPGPCRVPGVSPGAVPVSNGESISTRVGRRRARVCGKFKIVFFCPHSVHRAGVVVRSFRRLSTSLCTAFPQITSGNPRNTISAWSGRLPGLQPADHLKRVANVLPDVGHRVEHVPDRALAVDYVGDAGIGYGLPQRDILPLDPRREDLLLGRLGRLRDRDGRRPPHDDLLHDEQDGTRHRRLRAQRRIRPGHLRRPGQLRDDGPERPGPQTAINPRVPLDKVVSCY